MGILYSLPAQRLVASGGPVTRALRALRAAETLPPDVIRFPDDDAPCTIGALRAGLRRQIEADLDRVERCLGCLDLLDGDPDAEDGREDEDGHDDEAGTDDNGIADDDGMAEQFGVSRHFSGAVA